MGSRKNTEQHFVVSLYVHSTRAMPQRGHDRKGLRERNIRITAKSVDFRGSTENWYPR